MSLSVEALSLRTRWERGTGGGSLSAELRRVSTMCPERLRQASLQDVERSCRDGVKCRKELPAGTVADATQTPSKVPRKAQSRLQRQFELHECDEM